MEPVREDIRTNGDLDITSTKPINGDMVVNGDLKCANLRINGNLTVYGDLLVTGDLVVMGRVEVHDGMVIRGRCEIELSLFMGGVDRELIVYGELIVRGNTEVPTLLIREFGEFKAHKVLYINEELDISGEGCLMVYNYMTVVGETMVSQDARLLKMRKNKSLIKKA